MQRMEIPNAELTDGDAYMAMSTSQLLRHYPALITNPSSSATLTFAYKIRSWTSSNRGHLMPAKDSTDNVLSKQEEQVHMAEK